MYSAGIPFKTYQRVKKQMPLAIFLLVFRRFALLVFKNILFHPYKLRILNTWFKTWVRLFVVNHAILPSGANTTVKTMEFHRLIEVNLQVRHEQY